MLVQRKILISLVVIFAIQDLSAEEVNLRLCTASPTGNYHVFGEEVKRQVMRSRIKVGLIESEGSMDNLEKIAANECDAGIVQIDAYLDYQDAHRDARLDIQRPHHLYNEFIHLVCNEKSGIGSIQDLKDQPDAHKVLIGTSRSGGAITWDSLTLRNLSYSRIRTENIGGDEALQKLQKGEASCLMFVSGLRSKYSKNINESESMLRLVAVNDRDLATREFLGEPIYTFNDIPADTYSNLQAPKGKNVETLTVRAIFIVSSAWAKVNPSIYELLISGVERAIPTIKERMSMR